MTNATHAKDYKMAVEIGKKVKEKANSRNLTDFEDYVMARIARVGGPDVQRIVVLHEPDNHDVKFVVVPHKDIIDGTEPGKSEAVYEYRKEELPVAAHAVIREVDPGGTMSSEDLGDAIKALASNRPSADEFYFFKMGEYCVTQCQ